MRMLETCCFQSFGEYSALLSCFNIEAKQVRGEFEGTPYNGIVYTMTDDTGKPVCTPIKSSTCFSPNLRSSSRQAFIERFHS